MMKTLEEVPVHTCAHCGTECPDTRIRLEPADGPKDPADVHYFCCEGCKSVYEILSQHDLCAYYDLSDKPGKPLRSLESDGAPLGHRFDFLDNATIADALLDFNSADLCRITFHIPAIHCSSCIWLLENMYRLREGISVSRVNFTKK